MADSVDEPLAFRQEARNRFREDREASDHVHDCARCAALIEEVRVLKLEQDEDRQEIEKLKRQLAEARSEV